MVFISEACSATLDPFCPLLHHSYVIQFSLYCTNIILRILESFALSDHKNQIIAYCSIVVQSESRADMFKLYCMSFT